MPVTAMDKPEDVAKDADVVFLATAHEVSHDLVPVFLSEGCKVFDLSGAYRVQGDSFYTDYYGFAHQHKDILDKTVYGLAEWNAEQIATQT